MTYEQLKAHIEVMDEQQLQQDVTIRDTESEEYYPIDSIEFADDSDVVLDMTHPFLTFATNFNY